jgi:hypothetical protein
LERGEAPPYQRHRWRSEGFHGEAKTWQGHPNRSAPWRWGCPAAREVVQQWLIQRVADKSFNRQVSRCFARRAAAVNDPEQKASKHQAGPPLWDHPGNRHPTIEPRDLGVQPAQFENPSEGHQNVVIPKGDRAVTR